MKSNISVVDIPQSKVEIGDRALHVNGNLDSRPVSEVDHDREMVKLIILGAEAPWLPMESYTFRRVTLEG